MYTKTISILPLILCVCLNSCTSDTSDELSGDYFYNGEGNGDNMLMSHKPNGKTVYPNVIGYGYNSDFIIAEQVPDYTSCRSYLPLS